MREHNIKHENGRFWVGQDSPGKPYFVYEVKGPVSESESAYEATSDGLSIAIARCNYLAKHRS